MEIKLSHFQIARIPESGFFVFGAKREFRPGGVGVQAKPISKIGVVLGCEKSGGERQSAGHKSRTEPAADLRPD